jgi:hypothetical protein
MLEETVIPLNSHFSKFKVYISESFPYPIPEKKKKTQNGFPSHFIVLGKSHITAGGTIVTA